MSRARTTLEAQQAFKRAFGYQAAFTAAAPGCLALLGNHAEFNEGLALTLAINQYVQVAAAPRPDGKIELAGAGTREIFWLSDLAQDRSTQWTNPIKAVLLELRKRGVAYGGFNAAFHCEMPADSGLGATAAMQSATALIVRKLYPFKLTDTGCMSRPPTRDKRGNLPALPKAERLTIAKLCHQAAQRQPGETASLLDYISSLCGKSFHAMCVDCRFQTVTLLPMIGEVVAILCPSGLASAAAAAELARRRDLCRSAARILQAKALRSVDLSYLSAHRMKLSEHEYACAYHIVGEIQRVVFAERALNEGDFLQLGQYLYQSHESTRDFFQNSCLELDLLVDLARDHAGCIGARMTGDGFGGATINLVTWNHYEAFMKNIAAQYERQTGRRIKPVVCQMVDGAE